MLDRNTTRIEQVDLMKGICIFFVILFHCGGFYVPEGIFFMIRSVYLPAFFFCSGLFFSPADGFKRFLIKKTNMLLVPFVFFFLVSIIFIIVFPPPVFYGDFDWSSPDFYKELLTRPYSLPTWFLWAIFVTFVIFYAICRISSRFVVQAIIVAALWVVGCYLNELFGQADDGSFLLYLEERYKFFSLRIITGMMTVPFMFAGYWLRKIGLFDWKPSAWLLTIIAVVALAINFKFARYGDVSYFSGNFACPYGYHLLAAFGGITFLWIVCMKLKRFPVLSVLGEFSLVVLCVHYYGVHISTYFWVKPQTVRLLIALAFSFAGILILPRFLPWVAGRKPLFKVPPATHDDKALREESSSPDKPAQ